jgi:hypothetical protein
MVALARVQAAAFPELVAVRQQSWEQVEDKDSHDLAVALGVFDYVDQPVELLRRMGSAARWAVASFPSPGLRLQLRRVRYGMRGVRVHGYTTDRLSQLGREAGMELADLKRLGRAGHLACYSRPIPSQMDDSRHYNCRSAD